MGSDRELLDHAVALETRIAELEETEAYLRGLAEGYELRVLAMEASKAALIREVREWWHDANDDGESLERTLAKHEGEP